MRLRGFSLGEVILAGFVLTVGLLAISALMAKSLKYSFESRDAIIAVLLAQEGAELTRNVRDNDFAIGNDGFNSSDGFVPSDKHCRISYDEAPYKMDCVSGNGNIPKNNLNRYYLEYTSGLYKHTGSSGRFSRYIYVDYDDAKKEATIKSFVYWGAKVSSDVPSDIESGVTVSCTVANKCVYTEVFLTSWK